MTLEGMRLEDGEFDVPTVLFLGNEWVTTHAGGLNRYLADLTNALVGLGARPRAVVVVGEAPAIPTVVGVSRPGAPLPVRLAAVRKATAQLARAADVVDVHLALYAILPIYTTRLRSLPLVLHFHGPWAEESSVGRDDGRVVVAAKRAVERAVYRRAQVVVVLSEAFARLVIERYGVDPSRVVVVPPGVDLERFRPGDRSAVRTAFDVDAGAFLAVAVRRLDARMGLDVLLEGWAKVQADRDGAVLFVAGEGRERERLEALRARLAYPDGVRLLGRVSDDDLVRLYQAADVSVVPTRALEGFGLVTLESMACGTPAIVTDVGGLPDGVVGLDPSLVVPTGDADALAGRILEAAAGRAPSRASCRAHAETFSWDEVARHHVDIYRRAIGERPLRVAYVGHTAALSGGELALARSLPSLGGVDPIVVLAEDGPLVERLRREGVTVEVLQMASAARGVRRDRVRPGRLPVATVAGSVGYTWRLWRRLRVLRPDIVHTNTLKAALYGGVAGRLARVPVVWHVRDRIAPDYLPTPAVRLIRIAARVLPTAVIVNSASTLATLWPLGRRSSRIYDAVVPSSVAGNAAAVPPLRGQLPFTVGLVGRLAPWKGQDVFLRAFASAFPNGEVRARIVGAAMFGEDDWARRVEALAVELKIADRVDLVGFVEDMSAEYARIDVLVHASTIPEPFGQVVVEGMAAGLPVAAPDAGGPAEVITDNVDGLLYPVGDVEALAGHMRRLVDDDELRCRLGAAGRGRAEDFTPEKTAAQIMDVYQEVLRGRRR